VVEAIAVRRKLSDGGEPGEAIRRGVFHWKAALISIGHDLTARMEFIAPAIELSGQSAAGRKLPLSFGRQPLSGPLCIGGGVGIGNVYDWVVVAARDAARRTLRMTPVCVLLVAPPPVGVIERHWSRRSGEYHGAWHEVFRRGGREFFPGRRAFGHG